MFLANLYLNKDKLENIIDELPFEAHWPGYHYLGPGTKLKERLKEGDEGINPLDKAAKQHDIAYASSSNINDRLEADKILENQAWNRVTSNDAPFFQEKVPAYITTNLMKVKRMAGAGISGKKLKKSIKPGKVKNLSFSKLLQTAKENIHPDQSLQDNTSRMLAALRKLKKNKRITNVKRIIAIPQQGGALSLLPILGALNTLSKVGKSVGAVVSAIAT
ncbi:unnamed protein product, partial [Brugia timori]|uniref:Phospholip_A2_4 domain-containing protein n=1 Tax=Brugia timori TaxID=42155 RepID=A0A0R3QSP3_9BILA